MKETLIKVKVNLDEHNIPYKINWSAEDGKIEDKETNAIFISVWDKNETLRLDLWTKNMKIDDMNRFFCQILISLSNTYQRSIGDENIALYINKFAKKLSKKLGIII